jgi:hypothetical protein
LRFTLTMEMPPRVPAALRLLQHSASLVPL